MKTQILSLIGLVASAAVAAPGSDGCRDYNYDPPRCPRCPYKPEYNGNLPSPFNYGKQCFRECPKQYQQCYKYENNYNYNSYNNYEIDYKQQVVCPNPRNQFVFDIKIVIDNCQNRGGDCLNVFYGGNGNSKRGLDITESNLGLYFDDREVEDPNSFNYNNYCDGDYCGVPTENLPRDLCGKEIFVAVSNNRCFNKFHKKSAQYVKVKVNCKNEERKCKDYCCCPP